MRRSIFVGAICFLVGGASLLFAQTTGLRPDQFIALAWTWTGVQTFNGSAGLGSSVLTQFEPNAGTTGTTLNKLAKRTATGAVVLGTGDTAASSIIGICVSNCTTSGNATIAINGNGTCIFDGATTTGDYVVPSSTTGGDCHDTGSTTVPVGIVVIGSAQSTNVGAGTYGVDLNSVGIAAANNAKTTPGGSNTQLQYNNSNAFGGVSGATSDGSTVTFGQTQGTTETVTLSSNNYNAVNADCGKTKQLPTGTTPTVTLPNINPASGSCTIVFVTNVAISYKFQAASGGTAINSQTFFNTRGTNAGDTVVVILITPSVSAAKWNVSGDVTS